MTKASKERNEIKSFSELFERITWGRLEKAAFLMTALLMVMPVVALVQILIKPSWMPGVSMQRLTYVERIAGCALMAVAFIKLLMQKPSFKKTIADNLTLCIFIGVSLLVFASTVKNGFTPTALDGDDYRDESMFDYMTYLCIYFGSAALIRSEKLKCSLFRLYLLSGAIIGALALADRYKLFRIEGFHFRQGEKQFTAIFSQYNHYGYYLMLAVMLSAGLFIYSKSAAGKAVYMLSLLFGSVLLGINATRGCELACAAAFVFLFIVFIVTDRKRLLWLAAAGAAYVGAIGVSYLISPESLERMTVLKQQVESAAETKEVSDNLGSGRGLLWKHTIRYISERPILGFGVEGIAERLIEDSNGLNSRPHNEYLQWAAFFGIPAALLYLSGVISVYVRAVKQRIDLSPMRVVALTAAFSYAASAVFGNTMSYTAPFFFALLGLGYRSAKDEG